MKNIGKPCAGKLHARFDEGGQVKLTTVRLVRHRQTKGAVNGYAKPTAQENLLSTLPDAFYTLSAGFGTNTFEAGDGANLLTGGEGPFEPGPIIIPRKTKPCK